jgi:hypothetical protein
MLVAIELAVRPWNFWWRRSSDLEGDEGASMSGLRRFGGGSCEPLEPVAARDVDATRVTSMFSGYAPRWWWWVEAEESEQRAASGALDEADPEE